MTANSDEVCGSSYIQVMTQKMQKIETTKDKDLSRSFEKQTIVQGKIAEFFFSLDREVNVLKVFTISISGRKKILHKRWADKKNM